MADTSFLEKCTTRATHGPRWLWYYSGMKLNQKHRIFNRYTISSLAVVAIMVASLGVYLVKSNGSAAAAQTPKAKVPISNTDVRSKFSFSSAPLWYQGATNETSMALFHHQDGCFVSVQYKTGTVDETSALQSIISTGSKGGIVDTPAGLQTLTMQTNMGTQQYQLHQYNATGSISDGMGPEGGQEYGYVTVPNGYIMVQGNCTTVAELPSTLTALQAVKFDSNN